MEIQQQPTAPAPSGTHTMNRPRRLRTELAGIESALATEDFRKLEEILNAAHENHRVLIQ